MKRFYCHKHFGRILNKIRYIEFKIYSYNIIGIISFRIKFSKIFFIAVRVLMFDRDLHLKDWVGFAGLT